MRALVVRLTSHTSLVAGSAAPCSPMLSSVLSSLPLHTSRTPTACAPGYAVPPGASAANSTCEPCGRGSSCTGGPSPRAPCGELLTTDTDTAVAPEDCITMPGVAYMQGPGTATPCPLGTFSVGASRRNCTACPGGLTTNAPGATDLEDCAAPPGFLYRVRFCIHEPLFAHTVLTCTDMNISCACKDMLAAHELRQVTGPS